LIKQVTGTFKGVTRSMQCGQLGRTDSDRIAITKGCKRKDHPLLCWQIECGLDLFGQRAGPRQMVSVNVRIQDGGDAPRLLLREVQIDFGG
jgi:hypothetical protein